jgi:hypothetical protein
VSDEKAVARNLDRSFKVRIAVCISVEFRYGSLSRAEMIDKGISSTVETQLMQGKRTQHTSVKGDL